LTEGSARSQSNTPLAAGSHTVTAGYSGDVYYGGSTGTFTPVGNKAAFTPILSASSTSTVAGQPVTFSTTLSFLPPGTGAVPPTGTITFYGTDDGFTTAVGFMVIGGPPGPSLAFTTFGVHYITAVSSGDTNDVWNDSNAVAVTVTPAS
jgi:hypothetical protein